MNIKIQKLLVLFSIILLSVSSVIAKDMRFAQVTDVRYSKSNKNNLLEKVVNDINNQKGIEFVVFTGDNISKPGVDDLDAFLAEVKKLKCPYYIVIGDKDVNKRKDLSKKDYAKYLRKHIRGYKPEMPNYIFERKGVVFIVADGAKDVIPSTIGYYKDDVIEWLDANLDLYTKKPVIILQHFPLIPPINKETYYTYKADKYLEMLSKHNNVKSIISGHFGVNKEETVNNIIHISTAPIPNYRIIDLIDYDKESLAIWAEVREAK